MTEDGQEIFSFFRNTEKIRLFILNRTKIYKNEEYFPAFRNIFSKYVAILIQTMEGRLRKFYNGTNLLTRNNSIFVYHFHPYMNQNNVNKKKGLGHY